MNKIGEKIKKYRQQARLTQAALGEKCGWTQQPQSRISNYEQGIREPNFNDLQLIASALGITLPDLIADSEESPETREQEMPPDLNNLINRSSPRSQVELRRIAQAAADGRLSDDDLALLHQIAERIAKKE